MIRRVGKGARAYKVKLMFAFAICFILLVSYFATDFIQQRNYVFVKNHIDVDLVTVIVIV